MRLNHFKRTSVDSILSDFNKISNRLQAHVETKNAEAQQHDLTLNRVRDLKFQAQCEASRANTIIANMARLTATPALAGE